MCRRTRPLFFFLIKSANPSAQSKTCSCAQWVLITAQEAHASNRDSEVLPLRELEKRAIFEALDRAALEAGWRCRIRNATAGDQFDAPLRFNISR